MEMRKEELDAIEKEFYYQSIRHYGVVVYRPDVALRVIARCCELGRHILGIDAFILHAKGMIQPCMAESIDLSSVSYHKPEGDSGNWIAAYNFIDERKGSEFFFEIVHD